MEKILNLIEILVCFFFFRNRDFFKFIQGYYCLCILLFFRDVFVFCSVGFFFIIFYIEDFMCLYYFIYILIKEDYVNFFGLIEELLLIFLESYWFIFRCVYNFFFEEGLFCYDLGD